MRKVPRKVPNSHISGGIKRLPRKGYVSSLKAGQDFKF